jgi:hypothetical protein
VAGHDRLMRIMKQADQGFDHAANTARRSRRTCRAAAAFRAVVIFAAGPYQGPGRIPSGNRQKSLISSFTLGALGVVNDSGLTAKAGVASVTGG